MLLFVYVYGGDFWFQTLVVVDHLFSALKQTHHALVALILILNE